jgi:hypothetical protein
VTHRKLRELTHLWYFFERCILVLVVGTCLIFLMTTNLAKLSEIDTQIYSPLKRRSSDSGKKIKEIYYNYNKIPMAFLFCHCGSLCYLWHCVSTFSQNSVPCWQMYFTTKCEWLPLVIFSHFKCTNCFFRYKYRLQETLCRNILNFKFFCFMNSLKRLRTDWVYFL